MPTMADTDVDGIVAFLKKSDAKGHSVYEQLASVVQRVRPAPPRPGGGQRHARPLGHSPSAGAGADAGGAAQIVEEKPEGAVDLLETSLLQKATAFDYADTAPQPLVRPPARPLLPLPGSCRHSTPSAPPPSAPGGGGAPGGGRPAARRRRLRPPAPPPPPRPSPYPGRPRGGELRAEGKGGLTLDALGRRSPR